MAAIWLWTARGTLLRLDDFSKLVNRSKRVPGVQRALPGVFKNVTMELVRSRFQQHVEDGAARAAVLRWEGVGAGRG